MGKLSKVWRKLPAPVQYICESMGIKKMGLVVYKDACKRRLLKKYLNSSDPEKAKVARYVKDNGLEIIPYDFCKKYDYHDIKVYRDTDGYPFVIHNGKKLYGRKDDSDDFFAYYYSYTLMEQDSESPHCYVTDDSRTPQEGCIIAELGAAEGMFGLDYIEKAKKLYLFECSKKWHEPLRRTFAPWKEKIEVVPYFVGTGGNKDNTIQLDEFFKDREVTIVKADIERAELAMLRGGVETFSKKIQQAYICTYHNFDHPFLIKEYLEKYMFKVKFNKGFMLMYDWPSDFDKNMMRPGVIYGERKV